MVIKSKRLNKSFDTNTEIYSSRLDALKSMGLEPSFLKACENMFAKYEATVGEVLAVKEGIEGENDIFRIQTSLLEERKRSQNTRCIISAANDNNFKKSA